MLSSLEPVFARYESLRIEADRLFEQVRRQHPDCVACALGCSDCCHAVFDLPLVEALYLNQKFSQTLAFGPERSAVVHAAGDADRLAARLKRDLYASSKAGEARRVMENAARIRIRCPLLDAEDRCRLYEHRPVTCRLYGVPAAIDGEAHVCGKSAFSKGESYPTVALEKIQDRLADMSLDIAQTLGTRFKELHLVYVPVSMALLTRYDAQYLGIGAATPET
ncbi:MAG: YkgJ family cysteine cluster protein [Deltaproteobacteria bacterium]|jgi:Fe-S-cluster containining protein|nr:YkgJ family cysteine cluster protein [Deltaproteobacteria bacterium]